MNIVLPLLLSFKSKIIPKETFHLPKEKKKGQPETKHALPLKTNCFFPNRNDYIFFAEYSTDTIEDNVIIFLKFCVKEKTY